MTEAAGDQHDSPQDHGQIAANVCETNTEPRPPNANVPTIDATSQPSSQNEDQPPSGQESTNKEDNSLESSISSTQKTGGQSNQQPKLSLEQQLSKAKRDLESMVIKYARSESENLQNKAKSKEFETKLKRAIKDNESLASRIKILANDKNQLTETLSAKVAQLTVLEQKNCSLSSAQNVKLKELETELEQLRKTNEDLLKSIDTYKSKENELLDFSERLSMKQLLLQAELDKALNNAPDYKVQCEELVKENQQLTRKVEELSEQLKLSNESLMNERRLEESLKAVQNELELKSRRSVDELEFEMKVLKRKHQVATKELLKQIKCLQAALDAKNNTHRGNKVIS